MRVDLAMVTNVRTVVTTADPKLLTKQEIRDVLKGVI